MVIEITSPKDGKQWTDREQRVRMEADWLGYTLQKSRSRKATPGDRGGYRIMEGKAVYKGHNYALNLDDAEELVRTDREAITERLSSELSQKEKDTQTRLKERDASLFRERSRTIREYLSFVNLHLQLVNVFITVLRLRTGERDQANKADVKRKEIRYLNEQIRILDSRQADVYELLAFRDQLELEVEEVRSIGKYRRDHIIQPKTLV